MVDGTEGKAVRPAAAEVGNVNILNKKVRNTRRSLQ